MKILFDNGTPKPIAKHLTGHEVTHARQLGWQQLRNGELLRQAEESGFDVLLTTDKNIRHQQNLSKRSIAIVVLTSQQWPDVQSHVDRIVSAIRAVKPGQYLEVEIPRQR